MWFHLPALIDVLADTALPVYSNVGFKFDVFQSLIPNINPLLFKFGGVLDTIVLILDFGVVGSFTQVSIVKLVVKSNEFVKPKLIVLLPLKSNELSVFVVTVILRAETPVVETTEEVVAEVAAEATDAAETPAE